MTFHVTEVFALPVTLAVNCCVPPTLRELESGEMATVTGGAGTVTLALPDFEESAALTAVTVTVPPGGVAGAVYKPVEEINPETALPPATPFTCHVTEVLAVPVTVAENCFVEPGLTVAEAGETFTAMV